MKHGGDMLMTLVLKNHSTVNSEWLSWTSLKNEYKKSSEKIEKYITKEKNSKDVNKAHIEIAGSIKSDLNSMISELEKRCLYEYNTMSLEDIRNCGLTDKQNQIAILRQKKSIKEIALMLDIEPCTAYIIYKEALRKIEKYLNLKEIDKGLNLLSDQQRRIFILKRQGKRDKEIISELGITIDSLKTQKRRIKNKLGVTKL